MRNANKSLIRMIPALLLCCLVLTACDLDMEEIQRKIEEMAAPEKKEQPQKTKRRAARKKNKYKSIDKIDEPETLSKKQDTEKSPLQFVPLSRIEVDGIVLSESGNVATVHIVKKKNVKKGGKYESYMVHEGDKIGNRNGLITSIGKDERGRGEIVVLETIIKKETGEQLSRESILKVP